VVKRNTREANSPEVQRKNQLNLDLVTVTESRIHDLLTLRYINNWMSTKTCFIIIISLGRILWVFVRYPATSQQPTPIVPPKATPLYRICCPVVAKTTNTLLTTFAINVRRLFPSFSQPQHIDLEHCVALSHTSALLQQLFMYRVASSATISSELLHVI